MTTYPGTINPYDNPVWNPYYIPGWTPQNQNNQLVPTSPYGPTSMPLWIVRCNVVHSYLDGLGNPLGGYLTFEQSEDLLITDTTVTPNQYYTCPSRMVGDIPLYSTYAWNAQGTGKIHLFQGLMTVVLMATDNSGITILPDTEDDPVQATTWLYHVSEFFYRGNMFDITLPSANASAPVDLYSLIVPGTMKKNDDWNRGF